VQAQGWVKSPYCTSDLATQIVGHEISDGPQFSRSTLPPAAALTSTEVAPPHLPPPMEKPVYGSTRHRQMAITERGHDPENGQWGWCPQTASSCVALNATVEWMGPFPVS